MRTSGFARLPSQSLLLGQRQHTTGVVTHLNHLTGGASSQPAAVRDQLSGTGWPGPGGWVGGVAQSVQPLKN